MRKIKQSKRLVHRPGWQTGINVQQSVSGAWSSYQLSAVGTTMSWAQRGLQAWPERTGQLAKLRHGQSGWQRVVEMLRGGRTSLSRELGQKKGQLFGAGPASLTGVRFGQLCAHSTKNMVLGIQGEHEGCSS